LRAEAGRLRLERQGCPAPSQRSHPERRSGHGVAHRVDRSDTRGKERFHDVDQGDRRTVFRSLRNNVAIFGIFRGTHTGEGGPVPPTGKGVEADYVYVLDFEGDKISHMTKIWNDGISMQQLGWA
jgi:hypothetical protein